MEHLRLGKPIEIKLRRKDCYCHTCEKAFHHLGINRHTAMHRDRNEDCRVTYSKGDTYWLRFSRRLTPLTADPPSALVGSGEIQESAGG